MRIETYTDLVEWVARHPLVQYLGADEYYDGDDTSERNTEALNIVAEFVIGVPEWRALAAERWDEQDDDQLLCMWLMDDVYEFQMSQTVN